MTVVCICKTPNKLTDSSYNHWWDKISVGSFYNVVETNRFGDYILEGFPSWLVWEKESFAPTSTIEEKILTSLSRATDNTVK